MSDFDNQTYGRGTAGAAGTGTGPAGTFAPIQQHPTRDTDVLAQRVERAPGHIGERDTTDPRVSHATNPDASKVPYGLQEVLPRSVEEQAPDSIHPTSSGKGQSHATGKSYVPQKLQELVPESVERALPNAIHDTSGLPPKDHTRRD